MIVRAGDGVHQASLVHTMAEQDTPSRPRRRDHSAELKREVVQQCLQPGASVSGIALAHGINANLVFRWRRERLQVGQAGAAPPSQSAPMLLPVVLESPRPDVVAMPKPPPSASASIPPSSRTSASSIELDFAGARLRLRGAVDEASLLAVLSALRSLA